MTVNNHTHTKGQADSYSSLLSVTAVYISFAILATVFCATVPAFSAIIELPINTNALSYSYSDIGTLFSDSLVRSVNEIALLFALFLCACSLFGKTVILLINLANGLSCGCVLFYSIIRTSENRALYAYIIFYILTSAVTVLFTSICINTHRVMLKESGCERISTAIKLFLTFLTFGGTVCLMRLTLLLLF